MRTSFVYHIYFTIVTLITLTMMVASFGYILFIGLDPAVFVRSADERGYNVPPALFFSKTDPITTISCTDSCPLRDSDKLMVSEWEQNYAQWKEQSRVTYDARSLVNAISFFIVSTPLFFLHYRILRREYLASRDNENATGIFSVYFYIASLGTLVVSIVFAAMFINTVLRTWVITDANVQDKGYSSPIMVSTETQDADSLISCATQCGFTDEQVALAQEWKLDYQRSIARTTQTSWKVEFSRNIAGIVVTLPVFLYHWVFVRRESKKSKEKKSEDNN